MLIQEIRTIDELLHFMNGLYEKHGRRLWYRGEEDAALTLIPSIQRSQKRLDVERYITNDFYTRARQITDNPPAKHNYAAWVSLMQHYGLPTRMLDWSESPLIAAFFATETYQTTSEKDAGIWVLAPDLLTAGEFVRLALHQTVELDKLRSLIDTLFHFFLGELFRAAQIFQRELDIFLHGEMRVERVILEYQTDAPVLGRKHGDIILAEEDSALCGL